MLNNFREIILHLLTGLQFDICYLIKTMIGFKITEIIEDIKYFWEGGRTLHGGTWHFIGGLDNHLGTMLCYLTLISL